MCCASSVRGRSGPAKLTNDWRLARVSCVAQPRTAWGRWTQSSAKSPAATGTTTGAGSLARSSRWSASSMDVSFDSVCAFA